MTLEYKGATSGCIGLAFDLTLLWLGQRPRSSTRVMFSRGSGIICQGHTVVVKGSSLKDNPEEKGKMMFTEISLYVC